MSNRKSPAPPNPKIAELEAKLFAAERLLEAQDELLLCWKLRRDRNKASVKCITARNNWIEVRGES